MLIASIHVMEQLSDPAWPGCRIDLWGMKITWMSCGIATMLLAAGVIVVAVLLVARRWRATRAGPAGALEVLILFVRDRIARPALHEDTYQFLPFLLTVFVFVLGLNLIGLVPVESVAVLCGLPRIGGVPTSVPTVCAGLGAITLLSVVLAGLKRTAVRFHERHGWPMWLAGIFSPVLWFLGLSPTVPGLAGRILMVPLAVMELAGVLARCAALMIRLAANMLSGHLILAILLMFVFRTASSFMQSGAIHVWYVAPIVVFAAALVCILEMLVAALQAYIFTFLTAMFLGLYVEPRH